MRSFGEGEEALGYWLLTFRFVLVDVQFGLRLRFKPKAKSYLRSIHMAQPATSTPPKNIAKQ